MNKFKPLIVGAASGAMLLFGGMAISGSAYAQAGAAPAATAETSETAAAEPLSTDDLEVLVARIALYPDELVAVIVASSLYPLQIVEAERYLEDVKTKKGLKPKSDWDGSVVSLLNYPQVVKMMSDDLDWTQALGDAISNQQKDVLEAIQQLRDKAVAEGIIKTDDKVKVTQENDNVVIQPASAEKIYVPQYEPEMLYEPDYAYAPISYYPEPYPSYYYPTAPYFAAFVTGAVWGAVVDWNDWGVWGGNGNGHWGNDVNIDCNNCFNNNFNGKVNINDVDWKNVDRNKINFDKNQLNKIDRTNIKNGLEKNNINNIKNKSADLKRNRPSTMPAGGNKVNDVRKSTLEGLQGKPGGNKQKPGQGGNLSKPGQGGGGNLNKPGQGGGNLNKPGGGNYDRPAGKPKPAARPDTRPSNPSPLGEVNRGKDTKIQSNRGGQSMGGGMGGGGKPQKKFIPPNRGGGGGGGRGGGGGGRGRR